jgi:hypothetical protein
MSFAPHLKCARSQFTAVASEPQQTPPPGAAAHLPAMARPLAAPYALPPLRCATSSTARCPPSMATTSHSSSLATYKLPHHSSVASAAVAPWFSAAIREAVKHLDDAPFLELVRFGPEGPDNATFNSFSVPDAVVLAPELWPSIAETVSSESADVVVLVQRIPVDADAAAPQSPRRSREVRAHVEDACRRLIATGVGESMLDGHVGECCDEDSSQDSSDAATSTTRTGILPFNTARKAVKVKALPAPTVGTAPLAGYWGVVVQSKHHTGAEGAYLMKAVRSAPASPESGGCSCTHFSLTRICHGEHLERQFVESWLA